MEQLAGQWDKSPPSPPWLGHLINAILTPTLPPSHSSTLPFYFAPLSLSLPVPSVLCGSGQDSAIDCGTVQLSKHSWALRRAVYPTWEINSSDSGTTSRRKPLSARVCSRSWNNTRPDTIQTSHPNTVCMREIMHITQRQKGEGCSSVNSTDFHQLGPKAYTHRLGLSVVQVFIRSCIGIFRLAHISHKWTD